MSASEKSKPLTASPSRMKMLARVGFGGKGIVYLVLGILAIQGIAASSKSAALSGIASQPLGRVMLSIIAVGLLSYSVWRLISGIFDPHEKTNGDISGAGKRVAYVFSGLANAVLAFSTAAIAFGQSSSSGNTENKTQNITAKILQWEYGIWLVGLVAIVILVAALFQLKLAWTAQFREEFQISNMSSAERIWATRVGRAGHAARALIYAIISWFLAEAALTSEANDVGGLGMALDTLQEQPYGRWLLAVTGVGFISYSLYCFVVVRYRRNSN